MKLTAALRDAAYLSENSDEAERAIEASRELTRKQKDEALVEYRPGAD